MSWAAIFLGLALLLGTDDRPRVRAKATPRRPSPPPTAVEDDPLAVASTLDVFAACLRCGMAVSTAASATAPSATAPLARVLTRAADMLAMGADPADAWTDPAAPANSGADALTRLARRSATSGSALAQGVTELADQSRHEAADAAKSNAERASVLIAGPLGVCYLPAFVCLGIVPVVVGLAGDVLKSGIL